MPSDRAIITTEGNTLINAYRAAADRRARVVLDDDPDAAALAHNHRQAVAAQNSSIERLARAGRALAALRTAMMRALIEEQREVDIYLVGLSPDHPLYGTIVAAGEQSLEAIIDAHLRMIGGMGEIAAGKAGEDVRPDAGSGDPDGPVDRYFGAIVTPPFSPRLQPRMDRHGKTTYRVVDPGGFHG